MDASVVVAFACAVLAAAGTGVLVGRSIRVPRMDVIAWAFAVAAIAVALGAQALGAYNGFGSPTFRVVQLGAQLVAPLWLTWGLAELAAKSVAARFGAKLVTAAVTVVGAVVLITDPLSTTAFSKSWPAASAHYQIIPKSLLSFVAALVVVAVVVILAIALVRLRTDQDAAGRLTAIIPAGAAALVLFGLRFSLPSSVAYPALCAVSAALAAFAGIRAAKLEPAGDQGDRGAPPPGRDAWRESPPAGQVADSAAVGGVRNEAFGSRYPQSAGNLRPAENPRPPANVRQADSLRLAANPRQVDSLPRAENGESRIFQDDEWYRLDRSNQANRANQANGGYPPNGEYPQDGGYGMNGLRRDVRPDDDYQPAGESLRDNAAGGIAEAGRTGVWRPRTLGRDAPVAPVDPGPARPEPRQAAPSLTGDLAATQRLYGLIAIYTLAEGRDAEFDALAERVVTEVRASEPDALVYAVHSVPNAPMQRIFYEVYRDRTAYEEHKRHLYIQRFDVERGPYVLATNVIELGTQQAKLSPLPGLSQLFNGRSPGE